MADFFAAVGLMLVFEGLIYGGFPVLAKQLARAVIDMPESTLRTAGLASVAAGVAVVWLVRG
jgi:uncharacterized protein YjeT (DUF2065 family)